MIAKGTSGYVEAVALENSTAFVMNCQNFSISATRSNDNLIASASVRTRRTRFARRRVS